MMKVWVVGLNSYVIGVTDSFDQAKEIAEKDAQKAKLEIDRWEIKRTKAWLWCKRPGNDLFHGHPVAYLVKQFMVQTK